MVDDTSPQEWKDALQTERGPFLFWRHGLRNWPNVLGEGASHLDDPHFGTPFLQATRAILTLGVIVNFDASDEMKSRLKSATKNIEVPQSWEADWHSHPELTFEFPRLQQFEGNVDGLVVAAQAISRYGSYRSEHIITDARNNSGPMSPLYAGQTLTNHINSLLRNTRASKSWEFWVDWFQRFVLGDPMPWELQREIALIPDQEWAEGAERIAELIKRLEAHHLGKVAPQAETIEFNKDTLKFRSVPIELENADLISAMITRSEDCVEDAFIGANGLREDSSEVRKLRRAHKKYADDPQQLELTYTSAAISLRRQLHDTGELPKSEDNIALLEAVEEGALAIRAHHPEVARNRNTIAAQKLRELGDDGVALLEDAKPLLVEISEDQMKDDFEQDIPQLIADATTPTPSGAPPLPGVDESMRIFSRAAKMKLTLDDVTDKGAEVFDSKKFKTVRLGLTVGGTLSALVTLGLRLFGVF